MTERPRRGRSGRGRSGRPRDTDRPIMDNSDENPYRDSGTSDTGAAPEASSERAPDTSRDEPRDDSGDRGAPLNDDARAAPNSADNNGTEASAAPTTPGSR